MSHAQETQSVHQLLCDAAMKIGIFIGMTESFLENTHSCQNAHFRNPWPMDKNCSGCRARIENYMKRCHMQTAYKLFGWDAGLAMYKRRIERIESRRIRATEENVA